MQIKAKPCALKMLCMGQESDGIVPRVKAHAAELYGPPAYLNPMCRAIRDQHPSHIALVGNGPLTQQDRADIAACDKVLRWDGLLLVSHYTSLSYPRLSAPASSPSPHQPPHAHVLPQAATHNGKMCRFNLMNNWKRFEEGVHVWVVRHSKEARKRYWGINNIKPPDAERIINSTQVCPQPCMSAHPKPTLLQAILYLPARTTFALSHKAPRGQTS